MYHTDSEHWSTLLFCLQQQTMRDNLEKEEGRSDNTMQYVVTFKNFKTENTE